MLPKVQGIKVKVSKWYFIKLRSGQPTEYQKTANYTPDKRSILE